MSDNVLNLINRLFTSVLLAMVLFACQNMPETDGVEPAKTEYQGN